MSQEEGRRRRKLSAIMMADVSGFSRMMGANEERTVDLIKDFHARVRQHVDRCEGRVVDTAGDSVFGEFDSVVHAVDCARRIQQEQAQLNALRPPEERIDTRIGVHLGDVIVEDYHVYGDGVNIAARLEPLADPGGICISEAVYQQVRDKVDAEFHDLGLRELKNIQYPVRLFKIAPMNREPVAAAPRPTSMPAPPPLAAEMPASAPTFTPPELVEPERELRPWSEEVLRVENLTMLFVGGVLLLSPLLLFPSAGALPTGGAILLGVTIGRILGRRTRSLRPFLFALGIGIATGALFTNWSRVTNVMFVLGGAIVAAVGAQRRRDRRARHQDRERRRRERRV